MVLNRALLIPSSVNHVDFSGRAVFGFAFDGNETDENGQGTHTAGIAGSTTFGVAQGANIIAVKVMAQGRSSAGLINGFHWMVERHNRRKYLPGFRGSIALCLSQTKSLQIRLIIS